MSRDAIIIIGMLLAIGGALYMCFRSRLVFTRIGIVISAVAICLGLAYFGWLPLLGGSYSEPTYFGSIMLFLGLQGFCIFGAIEEVWRRFTTAPETGRGFPVIQLPRSQGPGQADPRIEPSTRESGDRNL